MLAKSLQKAGEQERAETLMHEVLAKDPSFDYRLGLVQILEEGNRFEESKKIIEEMLHESERWRTRRRTRPKNQPCYSLFPFRIFTATNEKLC